jgi:putative PIN family toxin of toxin-antitoxin system
MTVVFDSNIFISALVIPGTKAEEAVFRFMDGKDTLIISKAIIDEVLTVLANKFSKDREAISRTAIFLSELGTLVRPGKRIKVFEDDPDNRILECAIKGKADAIVTGDKAMLELKEYQGIRIITLKEYLSHDQ